MPEIRLGDRLCVSARNRNALARPGVTGVVELMTPLPDGRGTVYHLLMDGGRGPKLLSFYAHEVEPAPGDARALAAPAGS